MNNEYHSKLEFISGIIRIYDQKRDDSVHNTGIPFLFSVIVRWINPEMVEIMGLSERLTPSIWKSIGIELNKYGVNKVFISRYKNGEKIEKVVSLNKKMVDIGFPPL